MGETDKRFYPVFLDLTRRLCVVIGAGSSAEKRARQLVRYGADVVVICPSPSEELMEAEASGALTIEHRDYVRGDLSGAVLALCLTEDEEVRRAVFGEAESLGCLVNVAGEAELSSFILPSVVHREPLQIAISTGGKAPEAAKALRKEIGTVIGDDWSRWIELLVAVRAEAAAHADDADLARRAIEIAARDETRNRILEDEDVSVADIMHQARAEREDDEAAAAAEAAAHEEQPPADETADVDTESPSDEAAAE